MEILAQGRHLAALAVVHLAITDLQTDTARFDKIGQTGSQLGTGHFVHMGMGQYRNATASPYPAHRLGQCRPAGLDVTDLASTKVFAESTIHIGNHATVDQIAGEMWSSDFFRPATGQINDVGKVDVMTNPLRQTTGDGFAALSANAILMLLCHANGLTVRIKVQANHVYRNTAPDRRQLNTTDQTNATIGSRFTGKTEPVGAIVVGNSQCFDATTGCQPHQIDRSVVAIRGRRVAMQINPGVQMDALFWFSHNPCHCKCSQTHKRMKLILDFLPIVAFFLVYKNAPAVLEWLQPMLSADHYQAVAALEPIVLATAVLIPATILQIAWIRFSTGKFENMHLVTLALVIVMGGATVIFQDKTFIQWKPTVVNWLFAAGFLGTWLLTGKTLLERMMGENLQLPPRVWVQLNHAWTVFFVASGIANLVVAYNFSEDIWVDFKLFGLLGLTIVFVLAQSVFLYRYINQDHHEEQ